MARLGLASNVFFAHIAFCGGEFQFVGGFRDHFTFSQWIESDTSHEFRGKYQILKQALNQALTPFKMFFLRSISRKIPKQWDWTVSLSGQERQEAPRNAHVKFLPDYE